MTKGSPDYKKMLVSIQGGSRRPLEYPKVITLGGKVQNVIEKDLATQLANSTSLNMLRFRQMLRPNESFHASPLFLSINLTSCY